MVAPDGRIVYVDGPISETMGEERRQIRALFEADPAAPITLVISSAGGAATGALAMLDALTELRRDGAQIIGRVEGLAASAAAVLLQGCSQRLMGSHALLMMHGSSTPFSGGEDEAAANQGYLARVHRAYAAALSRRTGPLGGWTEAQWRGRFRSKVPLFFSPADALKAGLVDAVLPA